MDRRDFLAAGITGVASALAHRLVPRADPGIPEVVKDRRYSGVGWNGWGFYHVDDYYLMPDGRVGDSVPGSMRFEIWHEYRRDLPFRPLTEGVCLFSNPVTEADRDERNASVFSCTVDDATPLPPSGEFDISMVALMILSQMRVVRDEFTNGRAVTLLANGHKRLTPDMIRDDTRLGRSVRNGLNILLGKDCPDSMMPPWGLESRPPAR
jgi:hypothetical protein